MRQFDVKHLEMFISDEVGIASSEMHKLRTILKPTRLHYELSESFWELSTHKSFFKVSIPDIKCIA